MRGKWNGCVGIAMTVVAAAAAVGQDVERPPGVEVHSDRRSVRVTDADGKPVAGASVWRLRSHDTDIADDARYGEIVVSRATTGDDGTADTQPGVFDCVLAFKGDRAAFQCQPVPPEGIRLGASVTVRLRLRTEQGDLPAEPPRLRLFFPGGNCRHGIGPLTVEAGTYVFPPLPADRAVANRLQIALVAPGWWGGPYDLSESKAGSPFEVRILRSRNVRGVVLDEAGKPVERATVWGMRPTRHWVMEGATTDGKGAFVVPDVPAIASRAYVRARGFAPTRIDVPAGETDHDAGSVVLKGGVPLVGRVVEEDGVDVVGYSVVVEDDDGARIDDAEMDGRGLFRTGPLAPGVAHVRVFVHSSVGVVGSRVVTADLVPGKPDQTVTVPTGLRIRLVDADGKPRRVRSARLELRALSAHEDDSFSGSFSEIRIAVVRDTQIEVAVTADDGSKGSAKVTTDAKGRGDVQVVLTPAK